MVVAQSLGWVRPQNHLLSLHHHLVCTKFTNGIKMSQSLSETLLSIVPSLICGTSKNGIKEPSQQFWSENKLKDIYFATNLVSHIFYECVLERYGAFVVNEGYFYFCVTYMTHTNL